MFESEFEKGQKSAKQDKGNAFTELCGGLGTSFFSSKEFQAGYRSVMNDPNYPGESAKENARQESSAQDSRTNSSSEEEPDSSGSSSSYDSYGSSSDYYDHTPQVMPKHATYVPIGGNGEQTKEATPAGSGSSGIGIVIGLLLILGFIAVTSDNNQDRSKTPESKFTRFMDKVFPPAFIASLATFLVFGCVIGKYNCPIEYMPLWARIFVYAAMVHCTFVLFGLCCVFFGGRTRR